MLALVGIALVFLAVFGGYMLERGNPYVLMQPAEVLIVGGAAAGILLVSNPPAVIGKMLRGVVATFRAPRFTRRFSLDSLRMLYEFFAFVRRAGLLELEKDLENPGGSQILAQHPQVAADKALCGFVSDSLRMLVIGATAPHELDRLMDLDIEVQRRGQQQPVAALSSMADSLPGLGIVAAVLGVVITMEAIGGSPGMIGQKIAAALVGTFLGILLCYGVVGPLAARLEHLSEARIELLQVIRTGIVSFARGAPPMLAIEFARRSLPVELRPSFDEMENLVRSGARIPEVPKPAVQEAVRG